MDRGGMRYVSSFHLHPIPSHHPIHHHPVLHPPTLCSRKNIQVGAAAYRQMRWEGKTPLPKPVVLPEGFNGSLPSRDAGREIPYRVFKPSGGVSRGIHMHIHGGGWVLMSEA